VTPLGAARPEIGASLITHRFPFEEQSTARLRATTSGLVRFV
jgi:hypothetical protein